MIPNGDPEMGVSSTENVLEPDTAGQFIWYMKMSLTQSSGTYWRPPPTASGTGNGIGPKATSKSPYGRGGGGGAPMRAGALLIVAMASPQLPGRAKGAGCPAPGSLTGK